MFAVTPFLLYLVAAARLLFYGSSTSPIIDDEPGLCAAKAKINQISENVHGGYTCPQPAFHYETEWTEKMFSFCKAQCSKVRAKIGQR